MQKIIALKHFRPNFGYAQLASYIDFAIVIGASLLAGRFGASWFGV